MKRTGFAYRLLRPRYWPTWLGIGCWWLLVQLPYAGQMGLAKFLGELVYRSNIRRVKIARRNLELCFPEMTEDERDSLLRANMHSTLMGIFETGISWWWSTERILRRVDIEGLEHLEDRQGRGLLLLGMHSTCLELAGAAVTSRFPVDMVYRPHDNPVYDYIQRRGRISNGRNPRYADGMGPTRVFSRSDVRSMVRALKAGRILWSAFDQDAGPDKSHFVPFFGIPTATVPACSVLPRMAGVPAAPLAIFRRGGRYLVKILPPLENYPSGDEQADMTRYNAEVEKMIRQQPESYLWVHRRFKTRPEGEAGIYAGI